MGSAKKQRVLAEPEEVQVKAALVSAEIGAASKNKPMGIESIDT
jgi:hypothetical protein